MKKLTDNIGLKLLSILLALLLWLIVVSIDNPVMTLPFSPIPITVENATVLEESGKAFEILDSSKTVSISVRAERSVLSELSRDDFKAVIDMGELEDNRRVPITVRATRYSDRIQSITPRQAYANVVIEDLLEKPLSIIPRVTGAPPEGYAVGKVSTLSNIVRVSGPESIVSTVDRAEVAVNVSGMASEIHSSEPIRLYDKNGNAINQSSLDLSIDKTTITAEIYKTKKVDVVYGYTGDPAPGYASSGILSSTVNSITVMGEDEDLETFSRLSIPASAIDITGAEENVTFTIKLSNYLPSGIYPVNRDETTASVTIYVEPLQQINMSIPITNVQITNIPDGLSAIILDTSGVVEVSVSGVEDVIKTLNPALITGTVDIAALSQESGSTI